ncbi:MAG: hypothetical protein EBU23_13945 [Mycobacteriaceae bacterium]|nr:hypothetical protein [Mycobacteriaceae bacterium]
MVLMQQSQLQSDTQRDHGHQGQGDVPGQHLELGQAGDVDHAENRVHRHRDRTEESEVAHETGGHVVGRSRGFAGSGHGEGP